ncbi:hypothetical protein BLOT_009127 [Blomia tropicalis]|nr:hypothetical protein BLOT_009127 [Blomia tropicalis]
MIPRQRRYDTGTLKELMRTSSTKPTMLAPSYSPSKCRHLRLARYEPYIRQENANKSVTQKRIRKKKRNSQQGTCKMDDNGIILLRFGIRLTTE